MKKTYLLFWLFCFSNVLAQKSILVNTVNLKADSFVGYDALGAIYSITDNVFTKFVDNQQWQYKNPQLGRITKVDLQNPLKIVLFYQDFNTVVLVDNQLNETARINLNDSENTILPSAIGLAAGNRLWIYDSLTLRIGLYDYGKRELKNLTVPFTNNIKSYSSNFNYFRWTDEVGNAFECDVYGKIKSYGVLPVLERLQWISDTKLIYEVDDHLFLYDLEENKSTLIELEEKSFKNFTYIDQILSIFTNHRITNYKLAD